MRQSLLFIPRCLLVILALWCFPFPAVGEQPSGARKIGTIEGVTEYRLDNGLEVLLIPDPSKPTVTVNITYRVGSRYENYGEKGAAHLLEHLVFKGTPTFPNVPKALNEHGASWNGSTWTDRTNYFETMPASDENLEFGLRLEADRMINSFIRQSDLESEMTVVRNEFESGENSPTEVLGERIVSTAYLFHNYGYSTIGARSDIEKVSIARLQTFYRTYYQPDNAVLILAGRFDEQKALGLIQQYLGSILKPARQLPSTYTIEPAQDGERSVTLRRVGDVAAVGVVYHIPAAAHPDMAAMEILEHILADTPSGRLHKALVETQKAVNISSILFKWRDPSVIQLMAEVRKEKSVEDVRDAMVPIIESFAETGPTQEEVERAKNAVLKSYDLLLANSEPLAVEMSEWASMGDWRLFFIHRDRLKTVTPQDVKAVASRYLRRNNRTLGVYLPTDQPERVTIPLVDDLPAMIAAYKPATTDVGEAEAFDPTSANLEARTRRLTLPNGLKLSLLPKQTLRNRMVSELRLYVGTERELTQGRQHLNDLVATMLMRGTKKHTRQQITDELDRLKARVRFSGDANATTVSIETIHENFLDVARLVTEMLQEPSFDPKEFDLLKQERLAQLEEQRHEPFYLVFRLWRHHRYPKGHINYMPTFEEQMELVRQLTLDELKAFHRQYYGGAAGVWSVVGDFDDAAFEQLVRGQMGAWASATPGQRVAVMYPGPVTPINEAINTPDKANAVSILGTTIKITRTHPDYPALVVADHIFGGQPLSSRLGERIRQKEGLSYGVASILSTDLRGDSGAEYLYAISAPQNVPAVERAFVDELNKLVHQGIAADEVEKGKAAYLKDFKLRLADDQFIASRMNDDAVLGRTFDALAEWEAKIQAVTVDAVNAAIKKYLDPTNVAVFKAGDFGAASPGK
jgi:zinc protease